MVVGRRCPSCRSAFLRPRVPDEEEPNNLCGAVSSASAVDPAGILSLGLPLVLSLGIPVVLAELGPLAPVPGTKALAGALAGALAEALAGALLVV